jgi:hypothetical protein
VDPELLSLKDLPDSLDVGSLARSLFSVDTGSHSWSIVASDDTDYDPLRCSSAAQYVTTGLQEVAVETDGSEEAANDAHLSLFQRDHSREDEEINLGLAVHQSRNDTTQGAFSIATDGEESTGCDTVAYARQPEHPTAKRNNVRSTQSGRTKRLRECGVNPDVDVLRTYLTEEERKCQDFRHLSPQGTFLTPHIQRAVKHLEKGKTEVLTKILIYIGSPCLVGGLQDMLVVRKAEENCMALGPKRTLSRAERVHLIASLGHSMSRSQLLRRHHVLQLFKECGRLGASTYGIVVTPLDLAHPSHKPGNPVHRCVAEVTARMMQETFPDIESNTDEYRTKYRWITDLRRLGQRLHTLEARFGGGLLGLILDQGITGTDVGITDKM